MQPKTIHRIRFASAVTAVVLVVLTLVGTDTGRNSLAWVYLQSTQAITNATHFHGFPLDRLDPTCPQCM
jgi:hypothetical protein